MRWRNVLAVTASLLAWGVTAAPLALAQLETKAETAAPVGAWFLDEFDGTGFDGVWRVLNPSPQNFIAEGGDLLIANGAKGKLGDDSVVNLFKLDKALPDGDWVATVRVKLDAQTGEEFFFLALHEDLDNYVAVGAYTQHYGYSGGHKAALKATARKRIGGKFTNFHRPVWTSEEGSKTFAAPARSLPAFRLRLEKRRRTYYPAILLEGIEDAGWIPLERLAALRIRGKLAIGLTQYEDTKGETIATVDWVRVERLE